ncbi:MAG: Asp-tRNA(Asn)/Glu-tRNA(Gln) amidotransferase subunit GatB [Acidimicrobiales bacterium]
MTGPALAGYEMVVGLEVHCELSTATKLFCSCPNSFGDEPNTNVCPVCMGLPGSLPVLNRRAVELAMRIGTALHSTIVSSTFHRKNYFYPDMPKAYQISQYDEPINVGGYLELPGGERVGIVRAHLEEDTAKSTHRVSQGAGSGRLGSGRIDDATSSLIDYNRAGVPLVEIVSAPDISSAEEARSYVSELRAVLVATSASDGRMEEGSLRVDANVSVRPLGARALGTRCEIKNLNSIRSVGHAIDYEARRQVELISSGKRVTQQTRHWNEAEPMTIPLRSKEEAEDYRYFPDPDLVPLAPGAAWVSRVAAELPILPAERRSALLELFAGSGPAERGAIEAQVATVVAQELDGFVVAAVGGGEPGPAGARARLARIALSRAANELASGLAGGQSVEPSGFAELVAMEASGELTATQAKAVLAEMASTGKGARSIAGARGLAALGDDELAGVLASVAGSHPSEWARYLDGEAKVSGFLVGQVMRATRGRADGQKVTEALAELRGRGGADDERAASPAAGATPG